MTGKRYRLLTEAEYEYAARAGTHTAYPWGDDIGKNNANCRDCGSRWDAKQPAPVGSFAANTFRLYDMAGNVSQWVEDCWHQTYEGAPQDGAPWTTGVCDKRVVRGGGWRDNSQNLRSATRGGIASYLRLDFYGFRVGRTLNR
jgi:formylglycine-generating enzyme required for sulfatase activity